MEYTTALRAGFISGNSFRHIAIRRCGQYLRICAEINCQSTCRPKLFLRCRLPSGFGVQPEIAYNELCDTPNWEIFSH